jgi:hypothetical protein
MSSAVAKIAKPVMRGMHVADVKKYVWSVLEPERSTEPVFGNL